MDPNNPTNQVIEKNIVDLLGLQDDYELTWEDYFRALREAALIARIDSTKYTSEQVETITEELKRVRKEDRNTIFSTGKTKKYTSSEDSTEDKISSISKFISGYKSSNVKPKTTLIPSKLNPQEGGTDTESRFNTEKKDSKTILELVINIDKNVLSILKTLENQFKFNQKVENNDRKEREKEKKKAYESRLESGFGKGIVGITKEISKSLSPLQSIFDKIKNFIVWTFLGRAFNMFIKWFNDPDNRKTFDTIVKFLGDHWLLLVGSYLLFGNTLGRFVTKLLGKLAVFTVKMGIVIAKKLIPLIAKLGGKGKLGLIAAGGLAVAGGIGALSGGRSKESEDTNRSTPETSSVNTFILGGIVPGYQSGGIVSDFDMRIIRIHLI